MSFKYGKGSFLYSSDGKKYLDFVQGIAVNSLGHANPYLIKAVNKQSKKLWHISNAFIIPEGEKLAKRLAKKTFADFIIFQNSGAEATEAAIKVARRYFYSIGQPSKNRILCVKNSFHGRTLATIYASGSKKMTEGFGPKVDGFDHFEFGNHKDFKKKITKRTAAIMVETVMGEGGIKTIPNWCLKELRKICDKKKILLILDEVQCGIGKAHRLNLSTKIRPRTTKSNQNYENNLDKKNIKTAQGGRGRFKSLIIEKNFEPENPKQLEDLSEDSCKWPIGHPDEKLFYFCGRSSLKDFSYCKLHLLYAYQPKGKKEDTIVKDEVPDFIEKKINSA
ncbi:aminotransferase class III-fold pyridoxal phosphate-dependent enzyme [Pelagibacteraceae bacterium]|nr:aminotransferase class III-fold pyridoxal phosphate-dependent enzyme [Pelagibacteraceae bacterium]